MKCIAGILGVVSLVCMFPIQANSAYLAQSQNWDNYQYRIGSEGQIIDNREDRNRDEGDERPQRKLRDFSPEKLNPDHPLQEKPLQEGPV